MGTVGIMILSGIAVKGRKMRDSRVPRLPPRDRILDAAEELFHREGIRAVGVEAIATRAETTKMALYRHFESKDALVVEWLRLVTRQYVAVFERLAAGHPGDARAQLRGWAQFIADGLSGTSHRGCPFVNSIAELPDRQHPARLLIETHKANQARRVAALCAEAGIPDPEAAAAELTFVLEGAQVTAQNMGITDIEGHLMRIVTAILERRA